MNMFGTDASGGAERACASSLFIELAVARRLSVTARFGDARLCRARRHTYPTVLYMLAEEGIWLRLRPREIPSTGQQTEAELL